MIAKIGTTGFRKEVLLTLLILANCTIVSLHLLASDELNTIIIFNYEYDHGYVTNQTFIWSVLCHFQNLIYSLIFLVHSERRYRNALLLVIYWITYNTFVCFTPRLILEEARVVLLCSALVLTISLAIGLAKKEKRKVWKFKFPKHRFDLSIAIVLLSLPLIELISYVVPLGKPELNIMGYTLTSMGFSNVYSLFSYLFLKLFVLIPLLFFFFATKRWWKYALLIPIILAIFQIKTALNPNLENLDVYEFFEAAPFLILLLMLLLFLSNTAYYQSKMKEVYCKTHDHLEVIVQKKFRQREYFLLRTKDKWRKLKDTDHVSEDELYLLKQHLEKELQKSNY